MKRVICMLLVAIMVFTSSPLIALADELPAPTETTVDESASLGDPAPEETSIDKSGDEVNPGDNEDGEEDDSKDQSEDKKDEDDEESEEDEELLEDTFFERLYSVMMKIYANSGQNGVPADWTALMPNGNIDDYLESTGAPKPKAELKPVLPGDEYPATQIVNGDFSYHPEVGLSKEELKSYYQSKGKTFQESTSPRLQIFSVVKNSSDNTLTTTYGYDGAPVDARESTTIKQNWETTQTLRADHCRVVSSRFEWVNGYFGRGTETYNSDSSSSGYGSNINFGTGYDINPCVELNANIPAALYQDLTTNPGDIIIWSLKHASRRNVDNTMSVSIGTGKENETPSTTPQEQNRPSYTTDLKMVDATKYTFEQKDGVWQNVISDKTKGFAKDGALSGLVGPNQAGGESWKEATGVYIVPGKVGDPQTTTRFAFQSETGSGSGNFLDDVVFKTLAGGLKIKQNPDDPTKLIVEGYYGGDPEEDPELVYTFVDDDGKEFTGTIDMSEIQPNPDGSGNLFTAEVPVPAPNFQLVTVHPEGYDREAGDVVTKEEVMVTPWPTVKVTFDPNVEKHPGLIPANVPGEQTMPLNYSASEPLGSPYDTNEGYQVVEGWYTDKEMTTLYDFSKPVTEDITLYAKWSGDPKYKVTFIPNNGEQPSAQGGITPGAEINTMEKPTSPIINGDEARFEGWRDVETGEIFEADVPIPVDKNRTFEAIWSPLTRVDVFFDAQNGVDEWFAWDLNLIPREETTSAPSAVPERPGYIFVGWFADKEGTTPFDFTKPIEQTTIIYAKWDTAYTVTFDTQASDVPNPAPQTQIPLNGTANKPVDPTRNGYKFLGWFYMDPITGELKPYDFNTPITANITLYAQWEPISSSAPSPAPNTPSSTDIRSAKTDYVANAAIYIMMLLIVASALTAVIKKQKR